MKSFCMYREDINAPIFESFYEFNNGLISGVPAEKYQYQVPPFFYEEYDIPLDFGLAFAKEYYYLAFKLTGALMVTNFYNIGVTAVSPKGIFVVLFENLNVIHYDKIDVSSKNIFGYKKFPIGVYKCVVRQFDIAQPKCLLMVDEDGKFLSDSGEISTRITTPRAVEEIQTITGTVSAWRNGYDGIVFGNDKDQLYKFKVQDGQIELFEA